MDLLIGHTGFVGSTLARARTFDMMVNSRSVSQIEGHSFGTVICAGVSAEKWRANANPAEDLDAISRLIEPLTKIRARRFILISTVDVFAYPVRVDENSCPTPKGVSPYGAHRYQLEQFVREGFDQHLIIRLPALFGVGLKKNAFFDLMHQRRLSHLEPRAQYQWYPLNRLDSDICKASEAGLNTLHLASEPIALAQIADMVFDTKTLRAQDSSPPKYDMRSLHARLLGPHLNYALSAGEVLREMRAFVKCTQRSPHEALCV